MTHTEREQLVNETLKEIEHIGYSKTEKEFMKWFALMCLLNKEIKEIKTK